MTSYDAALAAGRATLDAAGIENAALDARLLLAAAAGLDAAELIARGREPLPRHIYADFKLHLARRAAREPVARIIKEKEFWGLPFRIDASTLVPRPETEGLVETVAAEMRRQFPAEIELCDLGTGCGAIIIALLTELPRARGVAVDISEQAIAIARENAARHGVAHRLSFELGDFALAPSQRFHGVVANPPYIKSEAIEGLAPEVRDHDPRIALDGGPDGLFAYRLILARVDALLVEGGVLGFEVGHDQGEAVARLCREAGLTETRIGLDLAGVGRVVIGRAGDAKSSGEAAKKALGKVA